MLTSPISCALAQMKVVVFSRSISIERFGEIGGNATKTVVWRGIVFVETGIVLKTFNVCLLRLSDDIRYEDLKNIAPFF